jgi:hypothetical protein
MYNSSISLPQTKIKNSAIWGASQAAQCVNEWAPSNSLLVVLFVLALLLVLFVLALLVVLFVLASSSPTAINGAIAAGDQSRLLPFHVRRPARRARSRTEKGEAVVVGAASVAGALITG